MSNAAVDQARRLIGIRFRAQGRDPVLGLDCLGLAIAAYRIEDSGIRRDYRLSGHHRAELVAGLSRYFRRIARSRRRPGDLMLIFIGERHWHLGIVTETGFIHADTRRGRVVETPGEPPWRIAALFRMRVRPIAERGAN